MRVNVCVGCKVSVCVLCVIYRVMLHGLISYLFVCCACVMLHGLFSFFGGGVLCLCVIVCDCVLLLMRVCTVYDMLCDVG